MAVVMTAAMTLSMGMVCTLPVWAADTEKGTLTISSQSGQMTGTLDAYEILSYHGQTSDSKNIYNVNATYRTIVAGTLGVATTNEEGDPLPDATIDDAIKAALETLETNKSDIVAYAKKLYKALTDASADPTKSVDLSTLSGGQTEIEKGYYLLVRTDTAGPQYTLQDFSGTEDAFTTTLKTSDPTITKTAGKTIMNVGDTIEYTLDTTMVNTYRDSSYVYTINDTMDKELELVADSIEVYLNGTDELTKDTDYELTTSGGSGTDTKITIKFIFTSEKLKDDKELGKPVTVKYSAKVLKTMTAGTDDSNDNVATVTYGTKTSESSTWKVYGINWVLNKVGEGNAAINGAQFTIEKQQEDDSYKAINMQKTTDGADNTYYYYDSTDATVPTGATLEATTGSLAIHGLDVGTYRLTETKAPDGYQSIDPFYIEVTATSDNDTFSALSGEIQDDAGATASRTDVQITGTSDTTGTITLKITDPRKGSSDLPATGGTGRIWVYVIGSLTLICGIGGYVVSRKREDA